MDLFDSLLMLAFAYVAGSSVIVWGATEVIKKSFFYDDAAKDRYLPFVAGGIAIIIGLIAWGYAGDFTFEALAPYLLGSVIIFSGSEAIHANKKKYDTKHSPSIIG